MEKEVYLNKEELNEEALQDVNGGAEELVNFQFEIGERVGYKDKLFEITDRHMKPLFGGVARLYTLKGIETNEVVVDAREADLKRIYLDEKELGSVVGGIGEDMVNFKYEIGQQVFYNGDIVEITDRHMKPLFGGYKRLYEVRGVESDIIAIDVDEKDIKPILKEKGLF